MEMNKKVKIWHNKSTAHKCIRKTVECHTLLNEAGILTRNESSRFSPPQMSMPGSYVPKYSKYSRLIANNPPAIVGLLQTNVLNFSLENYLLNNPINHNVYKIKDCKPEDFMHDFFPHKSTSMFVRNRCGPVSVCHKSVLSKWLNKSRWFLA